MQLRAGEPQARVEEAASGWWSQEVKTKSLAGGWMCVWGGDPGFLEKRHQFSSWGNWWEQQVGGVLELHAGGIGSKVPTDTQVRG